MRLVVAIVFTLSISVIGLAEAAGFDCSKASKPTDRVICSDSELSGLDEYNMQLYKTAKAKDSNKANDIRKKSVALKYACGTNTLCIEESYKASIADYKAMGANDENPAQPPSSFVTYESFSEPAIPEAPEAVSSAPDYQLSSSSSWSGFAGLLWIVAIGMMAVMFAIEAMVKMGRASPPGRNKDLEAEQVYKHEVETEKAGSPLEQPNKKPVDRDLPIIVGNLLTLLRFPENIKNIYKKSEAAAVIQAMLEDVAIDGYFDLNPATTATTLVSEVWCKSPAVYEGRFGQRPHKLTVVVAAMANGLKLFAGDYKSHTGLCFALAALFKNLEDNQGFYPFNSLDYRLQSEAFECLVLAMSEYETNPRSNMKTS